MRMALWLPFSSRKVGRPIDTSSACLPSRLPYFSQFSFASCWGPRARARARARGGRGAA